jgi:hypothetical protein
VWCRDEIQRDEREPGAELGGGVEIGTRLLLL